MPPCASGPVFTVRRPRRNGSACATAGAGKRVSAAAAPATLPAKIVRRLTLRNLVLPGMRILPFPRLVARGRANRQSFSRHRRLYLRRARAIAASAAIRPIIGEVTRGVKPASVAFFSTLLQRRIVARIDRMSEELLLGPSPELADIFVGFDDLVPQF